jgi:hypothetical protein
MQTQNEMTPKEAGEHSHIVATAWAEENADLLCVFNADQVNRALFGLFATTHKDNQPIQYDELSRALLQLVDRKVLIPEFQSDIATEQLEQMREKFAPQTVPSEASHPPTPVDANDFSQMTKAEFEQISTPDARRLYRSKLSFQKRADYFWSSGI